MPQTSRTFRIFVSSTFSDGRSSAPRRKSASSPACASSASCTTRAARPSTRA